MRSPRSLWILAAACLSVSAAHSQEPLTTPPAILQRVTGSGDPSQSTPIPDPTKLTTEAVDRLKEQLTTQFNLRIDALEKEIARLQKELESRPQAALVDEKFRGVNEQFAGRDVALAAALLAQKTSVADQNNSNLIAADKAEKSFIEQIRGIQSLLSQQDKAATDKIDDLKLRLQAIDSRNEGSGNAVNWIVVAGGLALTVVSIVGGILGIMVAVRRDPPAPVPIPVVQYSESPGNRRKP